MRVLVTDGDERPALAAVRSLGARGDRVFVTSNRRRSVAGASKHAESERALEDAAYSPAAWANAVEALAEEWSIDWILPIGEVSLGALYDAGVEQRRAVVCPERGAYERAVDKHGLLAVAESLGMDTPRSWLVGDPTELEACVAELGLPLVVKPRRSRVLTSGQWRAGDVCVVRSRDALAPAFEAAGLGGEVLVQEFVAGHGEGVHLLRANGRTIARFAHRRLREKPPTGGQSVLRESIEPDPKLLASAEGLLEALDFEGVAMVEFRRSHEGRAALMEVNPRLWGSVQLAIDAGLDFPALWLDFAAGREVAAGEARVGVRTRWLLGDVDHLLISLANGSVREETGTSVVPLLGQFLRSFVDGSRAEILRMRDPLPFLRELRAWLADLAAHR